MDQNELARAVAQNRGQALGEISGGVAGTVLAATNAVSRQTGIDRRQLFEDMLANLPEVEGAASNVIDVVREAIGAALKDLDAANR